MRAISSAQEAKVSPRVRSEGNGESCNSAMERSSLRGQAPRLSVGTMFVQQQMAEALFELVDDFQGRDAFQVGVEFGPLYLFEIFRVATHPRHQTTMFAAGGIELLPGGQEVMVEQTYDMKAIGNDHGMGGSVFSPGSGKRRTSPHKRPKPSPCREVVANSLPERLHCVLTPHPRSCVFRDRRGWWHSLGDG